MIRVHVICEGQTEEAFVNNLLLDPMRARGIEMSPALIGTPGHKGGNFKYQRLYRDVRNRLLGDKHSYCTTFFDFYGLPEEFPGKNICLPTASISEKSQAVQRALVEKLTEDLGTNAMRRFIPFVQMYEFESLLFSSPVCMAKGMDKPDLTRAFQKIADAFISPEHINNSPATAPSKRILKIIPDYEKPFLGTLAALDVGLAVMREKCVLFNAWLTQIEALAAE